MELVYWDRKKICEWEEGAHHARILTISPPTPTLPKKPSKCTLTSQGNFNYCLHQALRSSDESSHKGKKCYYIANGYRLSFSSGN